MCISLSLSLLKNTQHNGKYIISPHHPKFPKQQTHIFNDGTRKRLCHTISCFFLFLCISKLHFSLLLWFNSLPIIIENYGKSNVVTFLKKSLPFFQSHFWLSHFFSISIVFMRLSVVAPLLLMMIQKRISFFGMTVIFCERERERPNAACYSINL